MNNKAKQDKCRYGSLESYHNNFGAVIKKLSLIMSLVTSKLKKAVPNAD